MGAVLHTLNIRLFEEDLRYIVEHAGDRVVFLDASLAEAMPSFEGVEHEILMPDGPGERDGALDYEELVAGGDPGFEFPELDGEHRGGHVLHERHHRAAEGGAVLAPLDRPPHAGRGAAGLDGHPRGRLGDARGADVPRDGLGDPLHRRDGRRPAGAARARI